MPETSARVLQKRLITPQLTKLILAPTPYLPYQAGQYLTLFLPNNAHGYHYSIANTPNREKTYELHIRHDADNQGNQYLIDHMQLDTPIRLQLPFGDCTLLALDRHLPILFIAGGTGFAPIKAMLEQLQHEGCTQTTTLIWRAKYPRDLYLAELVEDWQRSHSWFHFIPQHSRASIQSLVPLTTTWQIILAGPFDMVYNIRDELIAAGVPATRLHSDAFAFEKK